jgi:HK97 family phage prohead protease
MEKTKTIYDFSGYATKNDLKCSDGRTIRKDAFKHYDGKVLPLVWQHMHGELSNILGHVLLENRDDGMYVYAKFNQSSAGQNAKLLVNHGDITALSIYANQLVEKNKDVLHGELREVSLAMAGANPGARIENLAIAHADGSEVEIEDEAIIYAGPDVAAFEILKHDDIIVEEPVVESEVKHVDPPASEKEESPSTTKEKTIGEIFDTFTDEQKTVVYALIGEVADSVSEEGSDSIKQSDKEEGEVIMANVFEGKTEAPNNTLSHAQKEEIIADGIKCGSLKQSFLAHLSTYGFEENISYLFPDAKALPGMPTTTSRDMVWVSSIMNGTFHSPFSRIKTTHADITAEEARALGYVKGNLKKDEVFKLLKRVTTPTTVYHKQKLDRDDILDITDFDVVAWMKAQGRILLDEEVARAALIGDSRDHEHLDKINEECIRPIYRDDDAYAHKIQIDDEAADPETIIETIIRARKFYKGSGNPIMYTTTDFLTDMLLVVATDGRRLYSNIAELEATLRVSKIIDVPVMEGVVRETNGGVHLQLVAIIVNPRDYTFGADKGGAVSFFEDFDIDYNQQKYLVETRLSGALTLPKSALVIEQVYTPGA